MHHENCYHFTKDLDENELRELMTLSRLRLQEVVAMSILASSANDSKALTDDERKLLRSAHSKLDAQLSALTAHRRV